MASKYRKKFELPDGFYEILEGYTREVLRDQPLDIIEFSYLYFKAIEDVSSTKQGFFRERSLFFHRDVCVLIKLITDVIDVV